VLAEFSGYIAADELYDGPFCVLFIVDNHSFHRLIYAVLDHDPTCDDIRRLFRRFRHILDARGLTLRGVTTDGSELYPTPIAEIFPGVSHQLCQFHLLKKLTKAVLDAVARVRKALASAEPKLPRGRPVTAEQKERVRKIQPLREARKALFRHRHLFVKHRLTTAERETLARITRGLKTPRALRAIMDEVYRLFDRRWNAPAHPRAHRPGHASRRPGPPPHPDDHHPSQGPSRMRFALYWCYSLNKSRITMSQEPKPPGSSRA